VRWLIAAFFVWSLAVRVWFGSTELSADRWWDERYGLENIAKILEEGTLEPANGYHPSLSYLPQAALLGATNALYGLTGSSRFKVFGRYDFSSTAYLICRLSQAVAGLATLYLTFLIGRRLFGTEVGWLAAFLLAIVPWHLRQSAIFKPDIELLLVTLFAFYLTLRAVDRPSLSTYLATGAAIGLALSTKFNAGPIAVPLMVAAAWQWKRNRRTVLWLILAGLCSIVVFLIFNPYILTDFEIYSRSFGATLRDYARKGATRGEGTHLYMLRHGVESLLYSGFHGPVLGTVGLAGVAGMIAAAWRRRRATSESIALAMIPAYVLGYAFIYAASTTNPSRHNWLPIIPFTALAAAWLLSLGQSWLARRWRPAGDRRLVTATLVVLGAVACWPSHSMAYVAVVPTTSAPAAAQARAGLSRQEGAFIYQEDELERLTRKKRSVADRAVVRSVESLAAASPRTLDLADAEFFPASRLRGQGSEVYLERLQRVDPGQVHRFEPRWFESRGPAVVLVLHPWRRGAAGPQTVEFTRQPDSENRYVARLPEALEPYRFFSFRLQVKGRDRRDASWLLHLDGKPLWAVWMRSTRGSYFSERIRLDPEQEIVLELPEGKRSKETLPVEILPWRQPETAG
jgi:hypothetical protein